jgi:hypothetical protein
MHNQPYSRLHPSAQLRRGDSCSEELDDDNLTIFDLETSSSPAKSSRASVTAKRERSSFVLRGASLEGDEAEAVVKVPNG